MSRKRKELPSYNNIEITTIAAEGMSLARIDDMVVFIPYGAPGDIVDIKIDKKKRSYAQAHIERIVTPSPYRCAPRCIHFGTCGGCKWQHLPYETQLKSKQQLVADTLERISKVNLPEISPILGSKNIWEYRNKMEYTFSNRKWLTWEQLRSREEINDRDGVGFHIPGAFDKVLDIQECHLQDHLGDRIRLFIKQYAYEKGYTFFDLKAQTGLLRTLMIRILTTNDVMAVVVFGENNPSAIQDIMDAIKNAFPEITSLHYVINTKANDTFLDLPVVCYHGSEYIIEKMEDLKFRIGPKSFYQTNSLQAYELYKVAREYASLSGNELVYDLYTGTGTIANFVAKDAQKVIGIEYVPEAIEDAKINSQINGIDNTMFLAGDMKDVLTNDFIEQNGKPDVIIVDPPRAGMHEDVVNVILNASPKTIVYVSCNPATQARDIAMLDCKYKVEAIQPVDMFPHTHHVENVVKLTLR